MGVLLFVVVVVVVSQLLLICGLIFGAQALRLGPLVVNSHNVVNFT